jgi:integrase
MEASEGKRVRQRVNLPSPEADVAALTVQLLTARSGTTFGRGFRLKAVGQRLYVQVAGRKIPLHLDFEAEPAAVQERALQLRRFLAGSQKTFDSEAWRDACAVARVRTGKPAAGGRGRPSLDEVVTRWQRLKAAEGASASTIERHYLGHLRRLDPRDPLAEDSLLAVIERTEPRSPTRRRVVAFLRRLCALHGIEWNAAMLDPLQGAVEHRGQAMFSDDEIEAILGSKRLGGGWRRVVTLLAVYGLRPWEAWVAEPCRLDARCAWVGAGKVNRHGATAARRVPPFHPEWAGRFELPRLWSQPLPPLNDLGRAGARVNQHLRRAGLMSPGDVTAYGFRHAYARRLHSPRYRVTDAHASLFMGHTVAAHHKAYRSWLGGEDPVSLLLDCLG